MKGDTTAAICRFKRYPAYKDSGIEWLGEIPAHWNNIPLFTVAREREVQNIHNQEANVLSLSYGKIIRRDISDNFGLMPASFETYQIVAPGNIILRLTDLQNDKRSLRVGFVQERGIITSAYVALDVIKNISSLFVFYLLHAYDITKVFYALGGGVRQTMKFEELKWLPILIPEDNEQRAITLFLNRETAKIDALVEKKEILIELLQEKRTALITRAVTKGLDPSVPMKDSGVEWLGEIPAHWETTALKRVGDLQAGAGFPDNEQGVMLEEIPFFKVGDMGISGNERDMVAWQHSVSGATAHRLGAFIFPPGTIVFAKVGAALMLNRRRFLIRSSCIDNNMMGFMPRNCDPVWAFHWLKGLDMGQLANPGAVPSVNEGQMRDTPVVVPPIDEQSSIAAFLDRGTAKLDALATKIHEAIARLKEYRASLISAAVTGKIDVRDSARRSS